MSDYILAIDPGETNGWATLRMNGNLLSKGQIRHEQFPDWLAHDTGPIPPVAIIVEDYVLFRKRALAQSGSRMVTSQMIGMVKLFASQHKIPIHMQKSDILPVAQKLSQIKLPGNHAESHWVSAFNHGFYWLVKNGHAKTMLERSNG